jgi:hypothetical protein
MRAEEKEAAGLAAAAAKKRARPAPVSEEERARKLAEMQKDAEAREVRWPCAHRGGGVRGRDLVSSCGC